MNKTIKVVSVIAGAILLFLGGYLIGNHNGVSREIWIGYQNSQNPDAIDFHHTFSDSDNQAIFDHFFMILLGSEKVENVTIDVENPDMFIYIVNPKRSAGLLDSRLSFTDDGAIIIRRRGGSWDEVEYYKISGDDAQYIKELVEYQERNHFFWG